MKRQRTEEIYETVTTQRKKRKRNQNVDYQEIEFKDLLVKDLDVLVWYDGDQFWESGYYPAQISSWHYEEEFGLKRLRIRIRYSGGESIAVSPKDIFEFGCNKKLTKKNMGKHIRSEYVNDSKAFVDEGKNDADYDDPKFKKGRDDNRVETIDRDDFEEERKELEKKGLGKMELVNFFKSSRGRKKLTRGNPGSEIIIPPPPPPNYVTQMTKEKKGGKKKKKKKKKRKRKRKKRKGLIIILRSPSQK